MFIAKAVVLAIALYFTIVMIIAIVGSAIRFAFTFKKDFKAESKDLTLQGIFTASLWAIFYLMS